MAQHITDYRTLQAALKDKYLSTDLRELAALLISEVPTRKDDRIQVIVQSLFADLQGIFKKLHPLAQHAVSEVVHTWGGYFQLRMFVNKYSGSPWTEVSGRFGRKKELLDLFIIDGRMSFDLFEQLQTIVPKPPRDEIRYTEKNDFLEEGLTVRETSTAALANLATFLTLAADKKIRVSAKTGKATGATVGKMTELLYEPDWYDDEEIGPMQSFAWPLLLQGGGLARADGSFLQLTPAGRKALKKDLPGAIQKAWQRWEKTKIIDEFSRVTAIKGQRSSRGRTMTNPVKRRPQINNLLRDLQPGKWISSDELLRLLQTKHEYSFEMVNYNWKLYFLDQQYGHLDYHDTWLLLQFRYILVYLFEYCATLGLIDVAYDDPRGARSQDYRECWGTDDLEFLSHCDGLYYIRINDLGAFVMGHRSEYQVLQNDDGVFTFDGTDLVVDDTGTMAPGQQLYLEKIAERIEVDRWRFSASSLVRALKGGENLGEIKKNLASWGTKEFSTEIEKLFAEVEYLSTAFIDVGRVSLIECSPEARRQALTNKKMSGLCLPAGERYLVAVPGKEAKFIRALESAGFILGKKTAQ
jgi:hypothetical protein